VNPLPDGSNGLRTKVFRTFSGRARFVQLGVGAGMQWTTAEVTEKSTGLTYKESSRDEWLSIGLSIGLRTKDGTVVFGPEIYRADGGGRSYQMSVSLLGKL